jgi:hypothetical protein
VRFQAANASCNSSTIEDAYVKLISTLTLATLLLAGSAFAADATATASKPTPSATTTAAQPDHHCRDDANGKKLAGAARKSFMKKCLADARAAK